MRSIETTGIVGADRRMVVQLPFDVAPGPHRVVVVIEDAVADIQPGPQAVRRTPQVAPVQPQGPPLVASTHAATVRVAENTFRREELYDDVRF